MYVFSFKTKKDKVFLDTLLHFLKDPAPGPEGLIEIYVRNNAGFMSEDMSCLGCLHMNGSCHAPHS